MILEGDFPPDVRVEKEIKSLISAGYEIALVCASPKSKNEIYLWNKATIIKYKMPKMIYKSSVAALKSNLYFNYWINLLSVIFSSEKFDAIHLHDLPLAQVAYKISQKYSIPFVLDLHENRPEIMKQYRHVNSLLGKLLISINQWQKYQDKYIKLADKVVVVTEEAKNYYVEKLSLTSSKFTVVPNYIPTEEFYELAERSEEITKYSAKFTAVYFGDTGLRRGTATIIEAAEKLQDQQDIHFIIIGDSKEQSILAEMIHLKKLNNVELLGWLPVEKAMSYMSIASLGICPFLRNIHHDTTFANKMFQYLALGLPVLVSDCSAQKRVVLEEECGEVFTAGDADSLAEKILLMKNSQKRKTWCENATKMVESKYHWNVVAANLVKVYAEI